MGFLLGTVFFYNGYTLKSVLKMLQGWHWEEESKGDDIEDISSLLENLQVGERSKYKVSIALQDKFTPSEVEQASVLFDEVDKDHSGEIDYEELRHVFVKLEEDISDEALGELFDVVDTDGTGGIDFGEFLHLLDSFKQGDSRFSKMSKMFESMDATPLAILQKECDLRKINLEYKLLDIRPANAVHPVQYILHCELSGTWKEISKDGESINVCEETRKYQGIGKNTRIAKFSAATLALSKLRQHIPGIDYKPGEIPDSWLDWFESNIDRGVDPICLLKRLAIKGFFPAKNLLFMQKLSLRVSMDILQQSEKQLRIMDQGRELPVEWTHWAQEQMQRGVHGKAVLQVLVENGFIPKMNPILTQLLLKDKGGGNSDPVKPRTTDFWSCASAGEVKELERYIAGGQDPNEHKIVAGYPITALFLAIKHHQHSSVKFLVENGADINIPDQYGKLSSHHVAQTGDVEMLKLLIGYSANIMKCDNYGDTCLHAAASCGHSKIVGFLLEWFDERVRRFIANKDIFNDLTFTESASNLFEETLVSRLSGFSAPVFQKKWMFAAVSDYYHRYKAQPLNCGESQISIIHQAHMKGGNVVADFVNDIDPKTTIVFAQPTLSLVHHVMNRYDPEPHLEEMSKDVFTSLLARCIACSFIDSKNALGKTALMVAADPLSGELESLDVIQVLIHEHGCDVHVTDNQHRTAADFFRNHLKTYGYELYLLNQDAEDCANQRAISFSVEPYLDDTLYRILDEAGEIQRQWRYMLSTSNRIRQVGDISEMLSINTQQIYYVTSDMHCCWAKPTAILEVDRMQNGWIQMKLNSKLIASDSNWDVYVHNISEQLFYFDTSSKEGQWQSPNDSLIEIVPQDDKSTLLCAIGFWEKRRSVSLSRVYYVNEKHSICQFERPIEWTSYGDPQDITPYNANVNWTTMFLQSESLRKLDKWEEVRHLSSDLIFYYNHEKKTGAWERPQSVLRYEQSSFMHATLTSRENGRKRKKLKVIREKFEEESGWMWREEIDNFKCGHGVKMSVYYVGVKQDYSDVAIGTMPRVFDRVPLSPRHVKLKPVVLPTNQLEQRADPFKRGLFILNAANERQEYGYRLCTWGCKDWIEGELLPDHQLSKCPKRQLACDQKCGLILRAEQWDRIKSMHCTLECSKRLVPCENLCGGVIPFDFMRRHLDVLCVKRATPPVPCSLNCGWKIKGGIEDQEHMKWEMNQHISFTCPLRTVSCDWEGCMAKVLAKELPAHRIDHLHKLGIFTWTTAGAYRWKVPRKCKSLVVQLWGGGGASGMLYERRCGHGGGGGFVQCQLTVHPGEELILVVGSGGTIPEFSTSSDSVFSCGMGGGYSALIRQGAFGEELLAIAGAGGGAGSRNGAPGGAHELDTADPDGICRSGSQGTSQRGGERGIVPANVVSHGEDGDAYYGGKGAIFGETASAGSGGSGLFGGGGGTFTTCSI